MKIQLISDAHLNMEHEFSVLNPEAEVFIMAGDMASSPKAAKKYLTDLRKQTKIPIIYVLGNHEYYGLNLYTGLDAYRKAVSKIKGVHLLEKQGLELEGISFWGTTLWSDLSDPLAAWAVQDGLSDYLFIEREPGTYIRALDTHTEYLLALDWLKTALTENLERKNIVITHHAPCWECRNTYFDYDHRNRLITHGFCNRLDTLMHVYNISHWLYGHTHKSQSLRVGGTQVVSNQVGYEHEKKQSGFDRQQLIDV